MTDAFAPIQLFPFPVFTSVIAGFDAHQAPLRAEILRLREQYPGVVRSNRSAWHSGPELLAHRSEHVAWLLQKMLKYASLCVGRYHGNWANSELRLAGAWANVLGPGGWNAPHHHFPCHWSSAFYVSVGDAPRAPGDSSGMIEFLNPTPWLSGIHQGGNQAYAPKEGMVLVFPASLYHFVHPHAGEAPRISIAVNFEVAGPAKPAYPGV